MYVYITANIRRVHVNVVAAVVSGTVTAENLLLIVTLSIEQCFEKRN